MSKKVFNPYRDMLDIPSLIDENPTDYQLLGIDDFESDSGKIAAAHEKRAQRIAELYQIVTQMSQKIDEARDRITDSARKEEYDDLLRRTGRAGVPHLGKGGFFALLFSFVLSIVIVLVATFYIYPMVVPTPPENIGDSVATLPNYSETETQKEIDLLKKRQEDISTMDVDFNLPIDLDAETSVDFVEDSGTDISDNETSLDNLPQEDASTTLVSPDNASPTSAIEDPAVKQTPNETSQPAEPAVPEQTEEEPVVPEIPNVPEPIEEQPSVPQDANVPEPIEEQVPAIEYSADEDSVNETPDLTAPPVDQPGAEQADPVVPDVSEPADQPSDVTPNDSADSAALDAPSNLGAYFDSDTPRVPKISNFENTGIPELPPLEEIAADPLAAPEPPTIPELTTAPEPPVVTVAPAVENPIAATVPANEPNVIQTTAAPTTVEVASNELRVAREGTKRPTGADYFFQLGQKARTDEDFAQLLVYARQAEDDLMKEKSFSEAQQIADIVYESCSRCADKAYRSEAFRQKDIVSKRSRLWEYVSAAESKMASEGTVSPSEANVVARWKIEIENDWQAGLQYLTLSDNEQVRNAAKNEVDANPADIRNVLTVANSWWNLSQDPVPMQRLFREHACTWYAKALPSISDKQIRILVEKRISMAEAGYPKR